MCGATHQARAGSLPASETMRHEEETLQIACVRWFVYQYPKLSPLLHHSPNGGYRNKREAARFKAMGTRAGFPDLFLSVPNKSHHGLYIEMKSSDGRQSESQRIFQSYAQNFGYRYEICRSFEEFVAAVTGYLG